MPEQRHRSERDVCLPHPDLIGQVCHAVLLEQIVYCDGASQLLPRPRMGTRVGSRRREKSSSCSAA